MQFTKFLLLLAVCVSIAHAVVTHVAPDQSIARVVTALVPKSLEQETWCDQFVEFVERSEAQVMRCVYAEGFVAGHALALRLIDQIASQSRKCPERKHSVRVANGLSNLKYIKDLLDLEVYQQARCPGPLLRDGAFSFCAKGQ